MASPLKAVPKAPGIYALFGAGRDVAYVGEAKNLKVRLEQHLIRRDSSVMTGVSVISLNPDLVVSASWWEHPDFEDPVIRRAAEVVAFKVLDPVMRSRGKGMAAAHAKAKEPGFEDTFRPLFEGRPSGHAQLPWLPEVLDRLQALEARLAALENRVP